MEQEQIQKEGFFKKIQNLFSSDIVIHNIGGNQLKVVDTSKIQTHGALETNSLFDKYNRIYTTSGRNAYNTMNQLPTSRIMLYTDYEAMDTDSIIASTLDILSDEVGLRNDFGEVLQIQSSDETLQKILYNLFYDVLNIEFNLWSWTRSMCKYGDFYLKLEISEKFGVYNVIPFSSYTMIRIEGENPENPSEVKFKYDPTFSSTQSPLGHFQLMNGGNNKEMDFHNYEIAHFRLLSDYNYLPYGRSYLEPARKIFKQLTLMEDAMLIHRIVRAPEKRTFFVNVGNIPPNEVENYMQKTINKMKKTPYIDPKTGDYNLKYNIQNILEDFYIPVRGGDTSTRIETTKGLDYTAIDDINYLRDKLFAALKVPKAYFGYEKDLSGKCISPETKIPLLDGRVLMVSELIDEYNNGIKNYVYSLDEETNNIVPGEIEWVGYTRLNAQIIRVWLDNNEYIDCTPDHNFLTRNGEWKEAKDLIDGESLMPLYLQKSTQKKINGYTEVYNPSTGKFEFVHRLVARYYGLKEDGKVIHHIDCNKLNNYPENLDGKMDFWEHRQWHVDNAMLCHTEEANIKRKNTWINLGQDKQYRESQKEAWKNNSNNLVKWIRENGASRKGFRKNHKGICVGCNNEFDKTILAPEQQNNIYCSNECKKLNWKSKYKNISLEQLIDAASYCKNFKELKDKLSIKDHSTLNKVFNNLSLDKECFIIYYMPLAHSNSSFMNQFSITNAFYNKLQTKGEYKNHQVLKIEWLEEKIDTCDLTISKYHNFGTDAGVIIHNSTLAAEDIRFARTVERIQRILISELTKIALVHLYAQGYDGESLTNFELSLTTPSIIYDQERVALLKEKADLANSLIENNLVPSDWVYDNIFHFSENQYEGYRDLISEDKKRKFRWAQIESEGNDPMETGEIYGTPSQLSSMNLKDRYPGNSGVPDGYDPSDDSLPKPHLGRPKEKVSIYNTQDSALGKDRTGSYGMKKDNSDGDDINPIIKKGALKLENTQMTYLKNQDMFKNIRKDTLFRESQLLNEGNILNEDELI